MPTPSILEETEPSRYGFGSVQAPVNSFLKYDDWVFTESGDITDPTEQLRHYLDYARLKYFEQDRLTADKEAQLRQIYIDRVAEDGLGEDERNQIGSQSTAFKPDIERDSKWIGNAHGDDKIDSFINSDALEQSKQLTNAKELLLRRGQLTFASLNRDGNNFVEAGNYNSIGLDDTQTARAEALNSLKSGALAPADLWQIKHGLSDSGFSGRSAFQAEQDRDVLGELQNILAKEAESGEPGDLTNAIESMTWQKGSSLYQQWFGDDPKTLNEVTLEDTPYALRRVQNILIDQFNEKRGIKTGRTLTDSDKYSRERIRDLTQELVARHANENNVFDFDEENAVNNIRITKLGIPLADPRLMMRRDSFKGAIDTHKALSDSQKNILSQQREYFMLQRATRYDRILSDFTATSSKWIALKANDPDAYKENPVGVLDEFLSDEENYAWFKNRAAGVGSSAVDAVLGLVHSVGVMLGSDSSLDYLVK